MPSWSQSQALEYYTKLRAQVMQCLPIDGEVLSQLDLWQIEQAEVMGHSDSWPHTRAYMVERRSRFLNGHAGVPLGCVDSLLLQRHLGPASGKPPAGSPPNPCLNCGGDH